MAPSNDTPVRIAFIAANRFGLGPRRDELTRIGSGANAWLREQIEGPTLTPAPLADLPPSEKWVRAYLDARHAGGGAVRELSRKRGRGLFYREMQGRILAAVQSRNPFVERMVAFWANHFTVSGARRFVAPIVGAFEREVVRAHLFGRFEDMLLASTRHPAMLLYLDNVRSVGPNSPVGRRHRRGLNENLAREILELHTLGVDGGYDQADVTEFARILTGWTVGGVLPKSENTGRFLFEPKIHEPGRKTVLGQTVEEAGEDEAIDVLRRFAQYPSTARHIAVKLARHFVADDPPAEAVGKLEVAFQETSGDLRALTLALIGLPEIWTDATPKVKTPFEFIVSIARALGFDEPPEHVLRTALFQMGQPLFSAPSPEGWPDTARDWLTPEALMRRVEFAELAATHAPAPLDAEAIIERTIGPVASPDERHGILAAPSTEIAVAMTFASAPFQRR